MSSMVAGESKDTRTAGYCSATGIYKSLHPTVSLPPESDSLAVSDLIFSFFKSSTTTIDAPAFVDAVTSECLSYSDFFSQVASLSSSLRRGTSISPPINSGDVALILSPTSIKIPVLYFSLLSLGAVVSPANLLLSDSDLSHIIKIAKPSVAFTVSSSSRQLPSSLPTIILDSPDFESLLCRSDAIYQPKRIVGNTSNPAAILYSSGTTGRIKGVELTQRNLIAMFTVQYHTRFRESPAVSLLVLPLFHMYGFVVVLRAVALAETTVLLPKFSLRGTLSTVERFKVTYIPVSPPIVVQMVKSETTSHYDLRSLELICCAGALLLY